MFMEANRRKNGAAAPGATASSDAAEQRDQETLSTNDWGLGSAQDRLFEPSLETPERISDRRTTASVDAEGPSWPEYGAHIPVGPKASESNSMRYPWTDQG
jgi:hypothetical protein